MASALRPTAIDDEPQIIGFLTRVFQAASDEPFVDPALLRWKYWEPRGDCSDPRSYVIERNGRIVAHVGLWPTTVRLGSEVRRGVHMIDWAADPSAPGAGVSLLQRLTKDYDFVYAIGGTEMTQSVLPKFGFRAVASAQTWARPIRPWRQALRHQNRDVRLPMRLARNAWWSRIPPRTAASGRTLLESGEGRPEYLGALACERGEEFFQYLERCPIVSCLTFDLFNLGRRTGFLALSIVGEQARVAGIWLEEPAEDTWREVIQLAHGAALQHSRASELVMRCSTKASSAGAKHAGMRLRDSAPVFVFRKDEDGEPLPLQYHVADNDLVFMRGRGEGFLT